MILSQRTQTLLSSSEYHFRKGSVSWRAWSFSSSGNRRFIPNSSASNEASFRAGRNQTASNSVLKKKPEVFRNSSRCVRLLSKTKTGSRCEVIGMRLETSQKPVSPFFAPEYGGDSVAGGGHPADSSVPALEAINDAFGQEAGGRGKTPGAGVPGSKTNPVGISADSISLRAREIWEEEGRPEGRAEDHWFRAENELRQRQNE